MRAITKLSSIFLCLLMVALVFAMPVNMMATDPIPNGMVSYWKFDEGSEVIAGDSADGNDGSLYPSKTIWTTGQIDGALNFDGANDYVQASIPLSGILSSFSYELWIYPISYNYNSWYDWTGAILLAKRGHVQDERLNLRWDGRLQFSLFDSSYIRHELISTGIIDMNAFSHIVATFDGYSMKIYVNGNLDNYKDETFDINWDNDRQWFRIGGGISTLYFNGKIDEVAVWNKALSLTEIQQHYNNGVGIEITPNVNTRSLWHFDDGTGSTAIDSSGFNNDGTLFPPYTYSGPTWTTGQVSDALNFDGLDDYVQTSIPFSGILSTFTYELWIYPLSYNLYSWYDWTGAVLMAKRGHVQDERLNLRWDGRLQFSLFDSSSIRHELISTGIVDLNAFSHVVATHDGNSMKIYINGNLDNYKDETFDINWDNDRQWFRIGGGISSLYFNGKIDEVAVWDKALSSTEIKYHYINGLMGYDYFYPTPDQAIQYLFDDIQNIEDLPQGSETNLLSKLDAALEAIDNGNNNAAIAILNAFINAVAAQSGKKLTVEQANALISAAQDILDTI